MKINNEQLIYHVFDYDVILFGMGINNSLQNGFSYEIALNFPAIVESENNTRYGDKRKYGTIHDTKINNIVFCACYVYDIGKKRNQASEFIDYTSLKESLKRCRRRYRGKKIACPIIGQDIYDGNGDKEKIIEIYNEVFDDSVDITLFDFKQVNFKEEIYKEMLSVRRKLGNGDINKGEFKEKLRQIEWKRRNGIFKPVDDDFVYEKKKKNLKKIGRLLK